MTTKSETISCLIGFITIGLFLSVLVTYLPSFAQTNNTNTSSLTNWKTYSSPLYFLKIMYPPDWQQGSQVSFEPIDNPKTVIVEITVKDVMPNSTLEIILRDEFSSIRSNPNINNITMSEPNKTKLKDGSEAYQYQFDYLSGLPFRQFDLVTVKDGIAYKLSYASQTEAFNRYLPIAKTMIRTFQPLGFTFD